MIISFFLVLLLFSILKRKQVTVKSTYLRVDFFRISNSNRNHSEFSALNLLWIFQFETKTKQITWGRVFQFEEKINLKRQVCLINVLYQAGRILEKQESMGIMVIGSSSKGCGKFIHNHRISCYLFKLYMLVFLSTWKITKESVVQYVQNSKYRVTYIMWSDFYFLFFLMYLTFSNSKRK